MVRANAKIDQGQVQNDQGQLINYFIYLFIYLIWPNGPTFKASRKVGLVPVNALLLTTRKFIPLLENE